MAATSFAGVKFDLSLYFLQCFVTNFACKFSELMHVFQGRQSGRPSIKSGTWNILEDPETFRNIPEHSRTSRNISQHPETLRNRSQNIPEHPESDVGFFVWALYELPRMFIIVIAFSASRVLLICAHFFPVFVLQFKKYIVKASCMITFYKHHCDSCTLTIALISTFKYFFFSQIDWCFEPKISQDAALTRFTVGSYFLASLHLSDFD